jgi:hypothetical protein
MRRYLLIGLAGIVAGACSSESNRGPIQPDTVSLPLRLEAKGGVNNNHSLHLSGDQEPSPMPPAPSPADSQAQGQGIFKIADDDQSFDYKLIASNIENITQAHIHCGPAGMNGPIMIWLYPSVTATSALPPGAGRHDGVLAEGTVSATGTNHVRVVSPTNAICTGGVANFAQALAKIRAGQAYVNVHTSDGVGASNQGPGDFPGGEIRGQF